MINAANILLETIVTEKAASSSAKANAYTFRVSPNANKVSVSQAVEKAFGVSVVKVNILNVKPKLKRDRMRRGAYGIKSGYKKAIVTLKAGDSIDLV